MAPSSTLVALTVVLSMLLVVSEAQERFQFCGGRDLIHAVIKVCSRSLPDELAPPAEKLRTVESTTTTTTTTTTTPYEDVDEYLKRLNTLLELMYAASELSDSDAETNYITDLRRVRRSSAPRRYRRSSMQRAKQVARKCCSGCSYADIQSLC